MVFVNTDSGLNVPHKDLLSWLFEEQPADPERPLFIEATQPDINLSWNQVKSLVQQIAAGLRANGVQSGDCICILSESSIYYYPTVYAGLAVGATFYGAFASSSREELANTMVPFGGATHVIAEEKFVVNAAAALKAGGLDISRLFVFNGPQGAKTYEHEGKQLVTWSALLDHGEVPWMKLDDEEAARNKIALRVSTSRSGGVPKIAQLSHYSAIAHIFQWCESFKSRAFEIKSLQYLNLHSLYGHAFLSTAVKLGFQVYLLRYSLPNIVAACEAVRPTLIMFDPHTLMQVIKSVPEGSDALQSLRDIRIVGMAFPVNLREMANRALHPLCMISRPYGSTETACIAAALYEQGDSNDPDSVGFTLPGIQVKLVAEDGSEITAHDTPGEILVRSVAMFSGYSNNLSETEKALRDGWFITGDIGYLSSKNEQWYLIGRTISLFKVGDTFVVPEDVEAQLVAHEGISDAAIVPVPVPGRPDPIIKALVVLKTPEALSTADVLAYANSKLSMAQKLAGVHLTREIPRASGRKIMRWRLLDLLPM